MKNRVHQTIIICLCILLQSCNNKQESQTESKNEKTVFQTASHWRPEIDVRSDVAIIYGDHDRADMTFEERIDTWREKGYTTHFMTGIAWGGYGDYFSGKWDGKKHWDAGQVELNGDTIWHSKGTVPYIVPVESFIQYIKENPIKKALDAGISSIYLEEPEFWARAGYSESFKKEWENFYGFPWRAQHESPENAFLSNKLKYHLYYRAIDEVSSFAKEYGKSKGLDVKVHVPTHSLVNYSSWEIVSPEASLASLPGVDGYIAQIWTGTSREPTFFNGLKKERVFENAFLEYSSLASMIEPTNRKVFFLTDPVEDWPRDWKDYKTNYQATFTAQLLYPNVASYEVMPWPTRIYTGKYKLANNKEEALIPRFYSTQMQVMINSLNDMPVSKNKINGSHGIGVLMSNTLMFQRFPIFEGNINPQLSNFYGLTLPLLKRGIPVNTVHIENLAYEKTLKNIKVLLMTYSNMKPTSPEEHEYIAKWVKQGGVLVYCSKDDDPFQSVMEWWNSDGLDYDTPSTHLLNLLGIEPENGKQKYDVGKGVVHILRNNPKEFVVQINNDTEFVDLVKEAYEKDAKAGNLQFKNNLHLQRGNYEIIGVLDESVNNDPLTLNGLFIDLFDPELPVLSEVIIHAGEQAYLYNINKIKDKKKAKVLAAASRVYEEVLKANSYSFICKSPLNTTNVMRILLPATPANINVSDDQGNEITEVKTSWDKESMTCFLEFENNPNGVHLEINW